jgi:hypothetical protein
LKPIEGESKFDKRTEETERNAPILEWTQDNFSEELKEGRYLTNSPMFTDGKLLYVVSQWKSAQSGEEGDSDGESFKVKSLHVERYDPETF